MTPLTYPELRAQRVRELRARLATILESSPPFVWEVGCGHGHFLEAYAAAHASPCIGVDLIGERIARAERKRVRAGHGHLHFLLAEARLFLEALPAGASIEKTFILFPDPWPKLRHHKHRILQPGFLTALRTKVEEGSRLYFRTDDTAYLEDARATLAAHPDWELTEEPWPFEFETIFQQRASSYDSLIARPARVKSHKIGTLNGRAG